MKKKIVSETNSFNSLFKFYNVLPKTH